MGNSMGKQASFDLLRIVSAPVVCVLALSFTMQSSPRESVRAELVRLQKQTGLTLATVEGGIRIVSFDKRVVFYGKNLYRTTEFQVARTMGQGVVSRDGTEVAATLFDLGRGSLAIVQSDGSDLREYLDTNPQKICWSYEKSKLAMTVHKQSPDNELEIMDLASNVTEEIDPRAKLTSQCWSPDDKKIVYEADDSIRVYEIGEDKSTILTIAKGENPTWSPDGNWITFSDHNAYYAIHPNGQERKKLFHYWGPFSPLYWSPDSRFVAYIAALGFLQGGAVDAELYRLRVRRLEDGSEDWVAQGQLPDFQWVTNPALIAQTVSDAKIMKY
jgi:Tol biopolymer transport system component